MVLVPVNPILERGLVQLKVKRYCWRLALCFVLGFSIIFGSTLSVNAASSFIFADVPSSNHTFSFDEDIIRIDNQLVNNIPTATYYVDGASYHFNCPDYQYLCRPYKVTSELSSDKYYRISCTFVLNWSTVSTTVQSFSFGVNSAYWEYNGYKLPFLIGNQSGSGGNSTFYVNGKDLYNPADGSFSLPGILHLNIYGTGSVVGRDDANYRLQQATVSIQPTFYMGFQEISKAEYQSHEPSNKVSDSGTQNAINNQTEKVEQGNTIAQENSDTNKDTNNKITNFFSSFFDNLIHIFVPEDGFFSQWFNDLNDFFAQKLGFLYAPFDFIISFFNGVLNTVGTQEHGFTIPALSWDGMEFCPEVHFSFDTFSEQFPQLQEAVYFFSDVVIILALMRGIKSKLDLVMGVHEE